ncbi:MAG: sensor histidine kinase [Ruminococcaceae bacterium]|nr:sensor histidine kinase [Oscillospiraceae bacterium]
MKELSLNILDVAKNSVVAGASLVEITLRTGADGMLTLSIKDDGCGMSEQTVRNVTDPFYTTRTTRKVGMGIPLLKLAAEQTGGSLEIVSSQREQDHGTTVKAVFDTKSIDFMPVGDIVSTMCILIAGSPEIDFFFSDVTPDREVTLNTAELREVLGADISLAEPEVQIWIAEYLKEQYN